MIVAVFSCCDDYKTSRFAIEVSPIRIIANIASINGEEAAYTITDYLSVINQDQVNDIITVDSNMRKRWDGTIKIFCPRCNKAYKPSEIKMIMVCDNCKSSEKETLFYKDYNAHFCNSCKPKEKTTSKSKEKPKEFSIPSFDRGAVVTAQTTATINEAPRIQTMRDLFAERERRNTDAA